MSKLHLPLVCACVFWIAASAAQPAHAASLEGLGFLPGGNLVTVPLAISSDGTVVVGTSDTASGNEAFRWTVSGGMEGLGNLGLQVGGNHFSTATSVSADGSTIVGRSYSLDLGNMETFRWTENGGMVGIGAHPGQVRNTGEGVSADGTIIVGRTDSPTRAYVWKEPDGFSILGTLGARPDDGINNSFANGISADGSIVVGESSSINIPNGNEAFLWSEDTGMIGLGDLPGGAFDSRALAISADGSTVVGEGRSFFGDEPFRWTSEGGMVGLGYLPGGTFNGKARAVSADGSIVVGQSSAGSGVHAFIWDETNGMRPLDQVLISLGVDLEGWNLFAATAISADGRTIIGTGSGPNSPNEGWIAVIPEPSTGLLLGFGLIGLATSRRSATRSLGATQADRPSALTLD